MTTEKDTPGVAYGRLLESAHFSSYGFERLCDGLEWLLKDDRWRQLGDWDINEFRNGRSFLLPLLRWNDHLPKWKKFSSSLAALE